MLHHFRFTTPKLTKERERIFSGDNPIDANIDVNTMYNTTHKLHFHLQSSLFPIYKNHIITFSPMLQYKVFSSYCRHAKCVCYYQQATKTIIQSILVKTPQLDLCLSGRPINKKWSVYVSKQRRQSNSATAEHEMIPMPRRPIIFVCDKFNIAHRKVSKLR